MELKGSALLGKPSSHRRPGCRFMQNYIEAQNIAKFKARLQTEADAGTRTILMQLLADEEAKHSAWIVASSPKA